MLKDYFEDVAARWELLDRMRSLPAYIDSMGYQALKVKGMKLTKRQFLSEYAQREYQIMTDFYRSKKKGVGKKML